MTKLLITAAAGVFATALLVSAALVMTPIRSAQANPAFAQQTGKGCPTCHTAPPALNATGKKFKANGNKL